VTASVHVCDLDGPNILLIFGLTVAIKIKEIPKDFSVTLGGGEE
jgi:hypothetical protein